MCPALADNLSKQLGYGYLQEEPQVWSADVLGQLDLMQDTASALVAKIGKDISEQITELVDHCTAPPPQ